MTIPYSLTQGAYIVAGLLFILALAGLSKHESAPMGNRYGIIGMTIALVITIPPRSSASRWPTGPSRPRGPAGPASG